MPKPVFLEWLKKQQFLKFQMGITGVPFGRTEVLVPPLEPQELDLARGKGSRVPGRWGFGKKNENVSFVDILKLLKTQNHEFGRNCSDRDTIDAERTPASSFRLLGQFWQLFRKKKGGSTFSSKFHRSSNFP